MIVKQNEYGMADAGKYLATLESYEDLGDRPDPFKKGETKHQVQLVWRLQDGHEQWDWVTVSLFAGSGTFGPSKLYQIASLLLGEDPPKELNLDDLLGRTLTVSIKRDKDQQGKDRAKIDGYFMAEQTTQPVPRGPITDADLPWN